MPWAERRAQRHCAAHPQGGCGRPFVRARSAAAFALLPQRTGARSRDVSGGEHMLISDRALPRTCDQSGNRPSRAHARGRVETETDVLLRCEAGAFSAGLARWDRSLGFGVLEWVRYPGTPACGGGTTAPTVGLASMRTGAGMVPVAARADVSRGYGTAPAASELAERCAV